MPGNQLTIIFPGFGAKGQTDQPFTLDTGFVEAPALNAVIDANGLLSARNGYTALTVEGASGSEVLVLAEHVDTTGATYIISAHANNRLYKGVGTLTDITGSLTPTGGNWFFTSLVGNLYGFQSGHAPIVRTGDTSFVTLHSQIPVWSANTPVGLGDVCRATSGFTAVYFYAISAGTTGATEPAWSNTEGDTVTDGTVVWKVGRMPDGAVAIGAFGRLWATRADNRLLIEFSDLLIPYKFRGGSGGQLDMSVVWGRDGDRVTAFAAIENALVVFGERNVAIFENANDVTNLVLRDNIAGTGTRWPRSVVSTGDDILFLARDGVWALSRRKEAGMNPIARIGAHGDRRLRLYMPAALDVTAAYDQNAGRYLLALRGTKRYFVYDIRLGPGEARLSEWDGVPTTPLFTSSGELYYGTADGRIAEAGGYSDNGAQYTVQVKSPYISLRESPIEGRFKIPKTGKLFIANSGLAGITFNWTYDYGTTRTFTTPVPIDSSAALWGESEWGVAEWSGGQAPALIRWPFSGHGSIMQVGTNVTVNGGGFSIQQLAIDTVVGRIS